MRIAHAFAIKSIGGDHVTYLRIRDRISRDRARVFDISVRYRDIDIIIREFVNTRFHESTQISIKSQVQVHATPEHQAIQEESSTGQLN